MIEINRNFFEIILLLLFLKTYLMLTIQNSKIKVYQDLKLENKQSFEEFSFENDKWEFDILINESKNSCYIRLSYWFMKEVLIRIDTDSDINNSLVIYAGPEHPFKMIDSIIPDGSLKTKICSDKDFSKAGIESFTSFIETKQLTAEEVQILLNLHISEESLNIAAKLKEFNQLYSLIWDNQHFYTQSFMDKMMFSGNSLTEGKYPQEYIDTMIDDVLKTLKEDFEDYFQNKINPEVKNAINSNKDEFSKFVEKRETFYSELKQNLEESFKDDLKNSIMLLDRQKNIVSYMMFLMPHITNTLMFPLGLYKKMKDEKLILGEFRDWGPTESEKNDKTTSIPEFMINMRDTSFRIDQFLENCHNSAFNQSIYNMYEDIQNSFSHLLKISSLDQKQIEDSLNFMKLYFTERFTFVYSKSITSFQIINRIETYIKDLMTNLNENDLFKVPHLFENHRFNFDVFKNFFYELRNPEENKLPIKVSHFFKNETKSIIKVI